MGKPNNAPWTPWMRSILDRMKELYNKPNARTIAEALPEISSGPGGEVTPASIVSATEQMNDTQRQQTRTYLEAISAGDLDDAIEGKTDKYSIPVNGIDYGVTGDGVTDDSTAIQALLDQVSVESSDRNNTGNGTLYLPNRTYLISTPLLINSNVHFRCDGRIVYNGTDSAVIVDGRYSFVDIAMISAPNGTGLEFAASRHNHETMSNRIKVDRIRPCRRGIYLHDHEGEHAVTTNYIYCDQIDSAGGTSNPGTYGIEVFADHHWLTEIHYYIGHVMNFQIGVYVHSSDYEDSASVLELRAGAQRFHRIQIEGVSGANLICGVKVHNSGGLHFHDARLNENFGQNQVVLSGKIQRCEFNFDFIDLRKIDFSGVTKATSNWFRGLTYNSGGYTHFGYEYCLTNNPQGDGTPCIIQMGRTVSVRIGLDSYQTVIDLATIGISVQAVVPGTANTTNGIAYSLARIDRTNEIVYFTGVYPTPSMDGCSLSVYKLENTTDSSGKPKWTKSDGTVYFQMQKNRVTEITSSSTDTQYPTAKAVWSIVNNSTVTEQTVTEWGFTKNTGTYSKPSGGIPKSDLDSSVQTSLDKADTALQEHQSLTGYATESWVEDKGFLTLNDLPIYNGGVS